jgi:AcrR family transcriptional regulator
MFMIEPGAPTGGASEIGAGLKPGLTRLPAEPPVDRARERILRAMVLCCAENGFARTSVDDVVARAAATRAEFDQNFRDLGDCLEAAFSSLVNGLIADATAQYSADKPLFQVVTDALDAMLKLLSSDAALARMAFVDCPTATRRSGDLYKNVIGLLGSLLDQVRVDSPPGLEAHSFAARTAVGGVEAMIRSEVLAGRAEGLRTILPGLVYCSLVPFLGQDESLQHAKSAARTV